MEKRCRRWRVDCNLRLGAGLGAAGLASGFAASHFCEVEFVVKLGDRSGLVEREAGAGLGAWSVGKMDEGRTSGRGGCL